MPFADQLVELRPAQARGLAGFRDGAGEALGEWERVVNLSWKTSARIRIGIDKFAGQRRSINAVNRL